ncbi:TetR/AcrR family transcriptional regulator [Ruegeria arenilitoris]|uniref:TetR/AcrR family transcriptional regulator n=1 Tax=Ruegeria arenilitoris TaxID=1173585 RepID=UPI00147CC6E5
MKLTDKKRKNILEAAVQEFQEHGFRGAKTTRIASKAGVSSRTLYNHFDSKEALFQEISEAMIRKKGAIGHVPFDPDRDLKTQFEELITKYVEKLTEPETIAITRMVTAEMLIDPERSKAYAAEVAKLQNPVTGLISEAMEAGALRAADAQYASRQLHSLIREFFYTPEFMLGAKQDTDGIMSDCLDMFLSHYSASHK